MKMKMESPLNKQMEILDLNCKKTSNNSDSSFGELHDELLISILCRLPYETLNSSCKRVSRRWRALISNPSFVICYLDHKRKTSLLPKSTSFMIETEQETSFITVNGDDGRLVLPNLTLSFLPCQVKVAATFKDLVLCYECNHISKKQEMTREYYICNPLTKQWVVLPPVVLLPSDNEADFCAALICEEPPSENGKHAYRFRVVVMFFPRLELMVFCSEIGQWKNVLLTLVPTVEEMAGDEGMLVVCNKTVFFGYDSSLGEFDPFCVDSAASATLEAKSLPPLPAQLCTSVQLATCRGRLLCIKVCYDGPEPWELSDKDNGSSDRSWEDGSWAQLRHRNKLGYQYGVGILCLVVSGHPKNAEEEDVIYLVVKYSGSRQFLVCECALLPALRSLTARLPQGSLLSSHHRLAHLPSPTPLPLIHSL